MFSMAGLSVGGYGRMSEDEEGGIERQSEDITDIVVKGGGDPASVAWYLEPGASAFKKKRVTRTDANGNEYIAYRVIRPVWHEALHALRTGIVKVLVVWDLDRLARDPRDLEDAIEVVQYYGATILSATASQIDLTTDAGIAWARMLVTMNAKQSADTARRVKREHAAAAEKGVPRGGGRPFGYDDDRVTIREDEAELIRSAADRLIGGASLNTIVREWTEAGVVTPKGNDWRNTSLRTMLINPRLAGWRATKDRNIVIDRHGEKVRGIWEPILDQETFDRLEHLLTSRDTVKNRTGVRKYMLSGILRCGICNAGMNGNYRRDTGTHTYQCGSQAKGVTGHSVTATGPAVDKIVSAQVGLRVVGRKAEVPSDQPFPGQARIDELDAMIADAMAELRANPKLSRVIYAHVAELETERTEMQESRSQWVANSLGPASASVTAEEWKGLTLEERRAHVLRELEAVVIAPARRRSRTFDPERLVYVWK